MSARRATQDCAPLWDLTAVQLLDRLQNANEQEYARIDSCLRASATEDIPHLDEWVRSLKAEATARLEGISNLETAGLQGALDAFRRNVNARNSSKKQSIVYFARVIHTIPLAVGHIAPPRTGVHPGSIFVERNANIRLPLQTVTPATPPPSQARPSVQPPPSGPRPPFVAPQHNQQPEPAQRYIHNVLRVHKPGPLPPRGWRGTWKVYPPLLKNINRAPAAVAPVNAAPAKDSELQLPQLQLMPELERVLKGLRVYEMFLIVKAYYRFLARGRVPTLRDILPTNLRPIGGDNMPLPIITPQELPREYAEEIMRGFLPSNARERTPKQAPLLLLKNKPRSPVSVENMFGISVEEGAPPSGPEPRDMGVLKRRTRKRGSLARLQWFLANGIPFGASIPRRVLRPRDEAREAAQAFYRMMHAHMQIMRQRQRRTLTLTNTRRAKKPRNESRRKGSSRYPTFIKSFIQILIMLLAVLPRPPEHEFESAVALYYSFELGGIAGPGPTKIEFLGRQPPPSNEQLPPSNEQPPPSKALVPVGSVRDHWLLQFNRSGLPLNVAEAAAPGNKPPTTTHNSDEQNLNNLYPEEVTANKADWEARMMAPAKKAAAKRAAEAAEAARVAAEAAEAARVAEAAAKEAVKAAKAARVKAAQDNFTKRTNRAVVPVGKVVNQPTEAARLARAIKLARAQEAAEAAAAAEKAAKNAANEKRAAEAAEAAAAKAAEAAADAAEAARVAAEKAAKKAEEEVAAEVAKLDAKLPENMEARPDISDVVPGFSDVELQKTSVQTATGVERTLISSGDEYIYFSEVTAPTSVGSWFSKDYRRAVKLRFKKSTKVSDFLKVVNGLISITAGGAFKYLPASPVSETARTISLRGVRMTFKDSDMNRPISDFIK